MAYYGLMKAYRHILLIFLVAWSLFAGQDERTPPSTTDELRSWSKQNHPKPVFCRLQGQIIAHQFTGDWVVRDATGGFIYRQGCNELKVGDIVDAYGRFRLDGRSQQGVFEASNQVICGHADVPTPRRTDTQQIASGKENFNLVTVKGYISEIISDETDPDWYYMVLRNDGVSIYVSVPETGRLPQPLSALVDADVELTGIALPHYCAWRKFVGPHLELMSQNDIRILSPLRDNPFDAPYLPHIRHVSPRDVNDMRRHRIEGAVLAVWHPAKMLIREQSDRLLEVDLAQELPPVPGTCVVAVGFPATDLFRLKLVRARCKPLPGSGKAALVKPDMARRVTARKILLGKRGKRMLQQEYFGELIRLQGVIRNLPTESESAQRMFIDSDGFLVPIDISSVPKDKIDLSIGCELDVAGICIMEAESWREDNLFPVLGGFTLVPRSPEDIHVLSRPSWWTPSRLLFVIGSLFMTLIAFVVWNRILRRLIERRSQQLFREQVAHASSDLKIGERTRLAVELHDSLSQTLTGVSFQIDAAEKARQRDPLRVEKHLSIAKRTLQSCREELRNCLWDLRNNALEETDTATAIRRTVEPHLGEAELVLDMQVSRAKLSDNTFHSILCILRELAVNAVRHGTARHVAIDGRLTAGTLTFSVVDDGCGFDPDNHPGMDEGHFGLQGISERIDTLGGDMSISSVANEGTTVTFSLKA